MLRGGGRFMVLTGKYAGEFGTAIHVERSCYPEITAILDIDRKKDPETAYSYFSLRNVVEV